MSTPGLPQQTPGKLWPLTKVLSCCHHIKEGNGCDKARRHQGAREPQELFFTLVPFCCFSGMSHQAKKCWGRSRPSLRLQHFVSSSMVLQEVIIHFSKTLHCSDKDRSRFNPLNLSASIFRFWLSMKSNTDEMSRNLETPPAPCPSATKGCGCGRALTLQHFQPVKDLKWGGVTPDPNAGIYSLEAHVENIWLTVFWSVCLYSMPNSFKHVRFVIPVLNKNSAILFYLEGCWQEIKASIPATVTGLWVNNWPWVRWRTIGLH